LSGGILTIKFERKEKELVDVLLRRKTEIEEFRSEDSLFALREAMDGNTHRVSK
jgi:hypothetical protein